MNEVARGEGGEDGMTEPEVRGHHVVRPPQAQSGLEVVPDDEYTFRGSRPRACASQDRKYHATRTSVSREERARKALRRGAMEEDLGKAGPIACQGSGWDGVNEIQARVNEKRNGVEPASSLATDSLMDCER